MSLLRAVFQTGFTHHGSHLVAVACMCKMQGASRRVHSPRFSLGCGRVHVQRPPPTLSCNQGPWSTQGIHAIFSPLLFVRDKNTTHVAKFAPSLRPVPLPPTPPEPKPLDPPPPPSQPFPDPFPGIKALGHLPRNEMDPPRALAPPSQPFFLESRLPHQASSGGYPPPPHSILRTWSTPPSTRPAPVGTPPHPTGHPSKNAIFLLFVRVRNDKNTTGHVGCSECRDCRELVKRRGVGGVHNGAGLGEGDQGP